MTKKQQSLLEELLGALPENDRPAYSDLMQYLLALGYVPQKQKVKDLVLSFRHGVHNRVIAKVGVRKQAGFISIKFFACASVPQKYMDALRDDIDARGGQYSSPLRLNPVNEIRNKCGYCGCVCTGGGFGYYCKFPDGREVARCGAYPIVIPDVHEGDIREMKAVILEQHTYFLSIA